MPVVCAHTGAAVAGAQLKRKASQQSLACAEEFGARDSEAQLHHARDEERAAYERKGTSPSSANGPTLMGRRRVSERLSLTWINDLQSMNVDGLDEEQFRTSKGRQRAFVDRLLFNGFMGILIFLNCVAMGVEADWRRKSADNPVWTILEQFFCFVWVFEAAAKLFFERCWYFYNPWNLLDFVLAILAVVEAWVLSLVYLASDTQNESGRGSLSVLSVFRVLRSARLLRLVKLLRMFKELWLIVSGFIQALSTLSWVLLLLCLVIYSSAIYLTIVVGYNCSTDFAFWPECEEFFGNIWLSMYTLFQVMTLESWSSLIARKLLKVHPFMVCFFVIFLLSTTFGMVNIIVGVIVENTLASSTKQCDEMAKAKEMAIRKDLEALRGIFVDIQEEYKSPSTDDLDASEFRHQTSDSGEFDVEQFEEIASRPPFIAKLKELNIHLSNPDHMFKFIDQDGSGAINVDEFMDGLMKYKAMPSNHEMHVLLMQVRLVEQQVEKIWTAINRVNAGVQCQSSHSAAAARLRCGATEAVPPKEPPIPAFFNSRDHSQLPTSAESVIKEDSTIASCCDEANRLIPFHIEPGTMTPSCLRPQVAESDSLFEANDIMMRLSVLEATTCRRLQALEELSESLVLSQEHILVQLRKVADQLPAKVLQRDKGKPGTLENARCGTTSSLGTTASSLGTSARNGAAEPSSSTVKEEDIASNREVLLAQVKELQQKLADLPSD